MQNRQRGFCANGRNQPGDHPQHGELAPKRGAQQFLARPQRPPDHQFLMPLTHADLHLSQQQQHATSGNQHHHHLQRPADLFKHLANLFEDRADIQQADGRKLAVKLRQHAVAIFPTEAGQPTLRLPVQRALREDKEEVRPQAFPVHLTQATDRSAEILGVTHKGHAIAKFDVQSLRQPFFHRHFTCFWRPASGG
ncbi:hypothetical protein D3C73_1154900 [compost metagenome]